MARSLKKGDSVVVPCARVQELSDRGVATYQTKVHVKRQKKIKVDLPNGETSDWIALSHVHEQIGILILNIGDFETEHSLLDPLAKSVAQFSRLLVDESQIRQVRVRSIEELSVLWTKEQSLFSHVVLIGHGSGNSIKFAVTGEFTAETLNETLRVHGAPRKVFLSLCCQTGYKSFGGKFSEAAICSHFIGPFHSVQGAIASQFYQTFMVSHLLNGISVGVAFKQARKSVPGSSSFRLWEAGKLKAGAK